MMCDSTADSTAALPPNATLPESADIIADKKGPGILLRTLKQGEGKRFPQTGDMCLIDYEGRLEQGSRNIIASSRADPDKPAALQFELGARHVLEGLEIAVAHMSVGQIVEATIPSLYAYGHVGYPPKIPPRATLIFQIELMDITGSAPGGSSSGGAGGRGTSDVSPAS